MGVPIDCFYAFLTGKSEGLSGEQLHSEVLKHAVEHWQREPERRDDPPGKYLHGKQAFAKWIESLHALQDLSGDERGAIELPSGMNYICLLDSRACAADYLKEWAGAASPKVSKYLCKAADLYTEATGVLRKENWDNVESQPELIRKLSELEERAVAELREVISWCD